MTALEIGTQAEEPGEPAVKGVYCATFEDELAGFPSVDEGIGPGHIERLVDMARLLKHDLDELRRFVVAISDGNAVRDQRIEAIRNGNHLRDRAIVELERRVLALQPCPELPTALLGETISAPTVRVRIQHTHTMKEGWRLAETTVEYTGASADWEVIAAEMKMAFTMGSLEAIDRQKLGTATS